MQKFVEYIKLHKLLASSAAVLVLALVGVGIFVAVKSQEQSSIKQVVQQEAVAAIPELEAEDRDFLQAILDGDIEVALDNAPEGLRMFKFEEDDCCEEVRDKADMLSALVDFIFKYRALDELDLATISGGDIFTQAGFIVKDYHYFGPVGGAAWLGFKLNGEDEIVEIVVRTSAETDAEVVSEEAVMAEEVPEFQGISYLEFNGWVSFSLQEGQSVEIEHVYINRAVPAGTQCKFTLQNITNNPHVTIFEEEMEMPSTYYLKKFISHAGNIYESTMTCMIDGEEYKRTAQTQVHATAASICPDSDFELGEVIQGLAETESAMVGTWRGCANTPFGAGGMPTLSYAVEIVFKEDGTYTSRNYDQIANPAITYSIPVFYIDTDGAYTSKTYDLDNLLSGPFRGTFGIEKEDGGGPGTVEITNLNVSTDGNRMYFKYLYPLNSSVIEYTFEKVE